jgi:hypothetical protein
VRAPGEEGKNKGARVAATAVIHGLFFKGVANSLFRVHSN